MSRQKHKEHRDKSTETHSNNHELRGWVKNEREKNHRMTSKLCEKSREKQNNSNHSKPATFPKEEETFTTISQAHHRNSFEIKYIHHHMFIRLKVALWFILVLFYKVKAHTSTSAKRHTLPTATASNLDRSITKEKRKQ